MSEFKFNYDFLKENATAGSWRRGYEVYQKDLVLEAYPEKNFFKCKNLYCFDDKAYYYACPFHSSGTFFQNS